MRMLMIFRFVSNIAIITGVVLVITNLVGATAVSYGLVIGWLIAAPLAAAFAVGAILEIKRRRSPYYRCARAAVDALYRDVDR